MKIHEVPQDDARLLEGKTRELQYAIDENGQYTTVKSVGWDPKNTVLQSAWEDVKEEVEEAKELVEKGKYSPLYFHMKKHIMTPCLLARYAGISWFRVRKHLRPKGFAGLNEKDKERYRSAFSVDGKYDLNSIE